MNEMKRALQEAFTPPPPPGKRNFLRQHIQSALPLHQILLTQIHYIRKWVWCTAAGIFVVTFLAALTLTELTVKTCSALTPLLALALVTECGRSERHGMAELETSTRLSLKMLVLARLGILGSFCMLAIVLLLPIAVWRDNGSPVAVGLYITTPFLLNTFAGLCIVRRYRGSEGTFGCVGMTACIVCLLLLSHTLYPAMYGASALHLWAVAALLLCWGIGKQSMGLLKQKEEMQWN